MKPITKQEAKAALGLQSDADLARHFGVNRRAVWQWPEDAPMPARRQWELRATRPDLFPAAPTKVKRSKAA